MSVTNKTVLITGTNGGLGLGICCRLVDDFLQSQPPTLSLNLIFTTRSSRKGAYTRRAIEKHLERNHSPLNRKRVHLQPEDVELTSLLSVRALARKLIAAPEVQRLDALVLNAGMAGWSGLDWPHAIKDILSDMVTSTTWPAYKLGIAGFLAADQFPVTAPAVSEKEPPLGQVFTSNVFGHYMLGHWLMPLLQACDSAEPGRIIWVSSIEPQKRHFNADDLQGLRSHAAYEHSKRLTDVLALTYNQPATRTHVREFQHHQPPSTTASNMISLHHTGREIKSQPSMHVFHPGVFPTAIMPLAWIVYQCYIIGITMARMLGSPWATVWPYVAACAGTWLVLTPTADLNHAEAQVLPGTTGGRVKWGSSTSRFGTTSFAKPTEVDGWGLNGSGVPFRDTWWAGRRGRVPGAVDATREDVEEFIATGVKVWAELEALRKYWEERIEAYEATPMANGNGSIHGK